MSMGSDGQGRGDALERVDVRIKVEDLELMEVMCGLVPAKSASAMIAQLTAHVPIPELKFLKRIRKPREGELEQLKLEATGPHVIAMIGPSSAWQSLGQARQSAIQALTSSLFHARVPAFAPNTREQFDAWSSTWPLNFRPPAGGMKAVADFSELELQAMRGFMQRALAQAEQALTVGAGGCGAVVVDPVTFQVVAEAFDEANSAPYCCPPGKTAGPADQTRRHPLHHSAMCAIHKVAAAQRKTAE
eukprot:CAMPEP_0177733508 /NCGR_PEP_ID=MMETSP0484_2-20121128/23720_1 /TAXON_ID=354590 /ORGANISM="Rhodomonas lens, Strain RHODO" /LENGTH=245 /DNA_ID=CAMNT_0019246889 /DNA_START=350 /DNA_END=1084 /DNA_ORIENTATION=+